MLIRAARNKPEEGLDGLRALKHAFELDKYRRDMLAKSQQLGEVAASSYLIDRNTTFTFSLQFSYE